MKVGFTGTRLGMSERQFKLVREKLLELNPDEVHHGDCVGADRQFHLLCEELHIPIWIHPPAQSSHRAYCKSKYIYAPRDYLERNKDIVCISDVLIGCPSTIVGWSGTRYTIIYAERMGKTTIVILP